jgi:diguanylate cyclase (GGDEF)-like protein
MTELVEHLADLTALRDRDALDLALVHTVVSLLQPQTAAICRIVGEVGNERWLVSAQLDRGQTPTNDSAWSKLDSLPTLSQYPLRKQVVVSRQVQQSKNVTVFPLGSTRENIGVLEITTDGLLLVDSLRLVQGILRLYVNFSNLLDYGERDSLTELLNRKTFDGAFLKATVEQQQNVPIANVSSYGDSERRERASIGTYWLAMIDIDHFKRVNDNYGHLIGDEVLLLLARLMRAHFRHHDQLYRFGGEEFVVLMRCNGEAESARVLERLRVLTQQHLFPQVGTITISIGFTEIRPGDSPGSAFERADKAVYYSKEHGRNQVCSFGGLVSKGEMNDLAANVGDVELF